MSRRSAGERFSCVGLLEGFLQDLGHGLEMKGQECLFKFVDLHHRLLGLEVVVIDSGISFFDPGGADQIGIDFGRRRAQGWWGRPFSAIGEDDVVQSTRGPRRCKRGHVPWRP